MTIKRPPPAPQSSEATTFGRLTRSQLMSRVRSVGNRTTEERMMRLLRVNGVTGWRRHLPLPGRPDFAWRRERVALFVDGCFWHGHNCGRNLAPARNADFWIAKIKGNRQRDRKVSDELRRRGWTVVRAWECQLGLNPKLCLRSVQAALSAASI